MILRQWAGGWLVKLIDEGGAHGPGSKRTVKISDDAFSYSYDAADDTRAMMDRRASSGVAAVTYERTHEGGTALWIDAVRYLDGAVVESVRLVQPYKKRILGKVVRAGGIVDLSHQLDH